MHTATQETAAKKRPSIDAARCKSKLCRNFVMGIPCPFNETCAFSHGDDDAYHRHCLLLQTADLQSSIVGGFSPPPSSIDTTSGTAADADSVHLGHHHTLRADAVAFDPSAIFGIVPLLANDKDGDLESLTSVGPLLSPPSYSDFMVQSESSSYDFSVIPIRFRYDPYTPSWIVTCNN